MFQAIIDMKSWAINNYHLPMVFAGTFAVSYYAWKGFLYKFHNNELPLPPSLWSVPFLGSLPFLPDFSEWHRYFLKKSGEIGPVFSMKFGERYAVVLNGRQALHEALVKRSLDFADRDEFYTNQAYLNVGSKGILDHHYDAEFRRQRQLCLSILKEFGFGKDIMEERILAEVSTLIQHIHDLDGLPLWPDNVITACVLNVIVSITFGYRFEDEQLEELIAVVHGFVHDTIGSVPVDFCPALRFVPHFAHELKGLVHFNTRLFKIIDNGIKTAGEDSFVSHYVNEEGSRIDDEQLRYIVRDLVMAGTETSTSTLLWAVCLLALPTGKSAQGKMRAEIDAVVERGRFPSLADRPYMPFVDATILEVMRVKTIVPLSLTHRALRKTCLQGFHIPEGTMVIPNLYSAHMDPSVWENPEEFRPERFIDETGKLTGKDRIVPFSLGRRSCLGELLAQQEIYLFLAAIVQNFTIEPPEGCEMKESREKVSITVAPERYEVRLLPRV